MKKIMMAVAIVCAAVGVQAASVQWGGACAGDTKDDTPLANQQYALLFSTTAFSGAATSLDTFAVGGEANNGGTIVATYTLESDDVSNYGFSTTWSRSGQDVNGYYAILALNDDGSAASYMDMGNVTGTTAQSAATAVIYNESWLDSEDNYLSMNGYNVTVGAAPEPTSGLLLLIGMAGLALRRRRA